MEQAIEIVKESATFVEGGKDVAVLATRPQIIELAPGDLERVGGGIVALTI